MLTVFIGQSFLFQPISENKQEFYTFYGANRLAANTWQVNFSKDQISYSSDFNSSSTPFCLNLESGTSLRIPGYSIYKRKDGSLGMNSDYWDNTKGACDVTSIRIIEIGQDFLTLDYVLAK